MGPTRTTDKRIGSLTSQQPRITTARMLAAIPFPDISPEIVSVEIFGFTLALRWYAMGYIVGIALVWMIIKAALRRWRICPRISCWA